MFFFYFVLCSFPSSVFPLFPSATQHIHIGSKYFINYCLFWGRLWDTNTKIYLYIEWMCSELMEGFGYYRGAMWAPLEQHAHCQSVTLLLSWWVWHSCSWGFHSLRIRAFRFCRSYVFLYWVLFFLFCRWRP